MYFAIGVGQKLTALEASATLSGDLLCLKIKASYIVDVIVFSNINNFVTYLFYYTKSKLGFLLFRLN